LKLSLPVHQPDIALLKTDGFNNREKNGGSSTFRHIYRQSKPTLFPPDLSNLTFQSLEECKTINPSSFCKQRPGSSFPEFGATSFTLWNDTS
jgi:hypothetical protein